MSNDDVDFMADSLLMYAGIPSSEAGKYHDEAKRLLKLYSFKKAFSEIRILYRRLNPDAADPAK